MNKNKGIINLIDAISISSLLHKHKADHYYKAFKAKAQNNPIKE